MFAFALFVACATPSDTADTGTDTADTGTDTGDTGSDTGTDTGDTGTDTGDTGADTGVDYDLVGCTATTEGEWDGDASRDWARQIVYDADEREIELREDNDGAGFTYEVYLQYDARGRLAARQDWYHGVLDNTRTWTWSEGDTVETLEGDLFADGTIDYRSVLTYDAMGGLLRAVADHDADGDAEQELTWVRDEWGNAASERVDLDGDGVVDQITLATCIGPAACISEEVDTDADGVPERIVEREFDGDLHQLAHRVDSDADGDWDEERLSTWNTEGQRVAETLDQDGDGDVDYSVAYTYGADGYLTRAEGVNGAQGFAIAYSWSERGELLGTQTWTDGVATWIDAYSWGVHGRERYEADWTADGAWDEVYTTTYACP